MFVVVEEMELGKFLYLILNSAALLLFLEILNEKHEDELVPLIPFIYIH